MEAAFDNLSMEFVYLCLAKYGFDVSAIKIFRNIYSEAMAMSYINGSMSKLIMDLSGNLRQGGCGSMEIFAVGVNPLLQLLEDKLKGVTIYSTPVQGPVQENEEELKPLEKVVKVVGFVDDACPVVTSEEEIPLLINAYNCLKLPVVANFTEIPVPKNAKSPCMALGDVSTIKTIFLFHFCK